MNYLEISNIFNPLRNLCQEIIDSPFRKLTFHLQIETYINPADLTFGREKNGGK